MKTDLSKNNVYFIPKIKLNIVETITTHVIIFLILQIFNSVPRLNRNRWIGYTVSEIS
jgi:hypothetical protein